MGAIRKDVLVALCSLLVAAITTTDTVATLGYDGSKTDSINSVSYTTQQYANDVVATVKVQSAARKFLDELGIRQHFQSVALMSPQHQPEGTYVLTHVLTSFKLSLEESC